ncbi:U2 small nuclear ribonucleoprotein B'', putative [Plasmodium vivax]|uniref:U2 small nuclear ribonucleoprotein B'', putative n=3 Tax=Plasmodium vivax TaxID=5855 RepID=A5KE95_PLAVS|nr:U2 small nuclear ribonucleoprotein B'', putative [Plasmodium vivax]EDL42313.1 U2 small nuclear ribonucleoprotein B'', putative [Plasmodium vivax]KMZ87304.1 U2 small nuclear ribonucleoprotein B'' [Plasmodium vivax Brazil I]SCO66680.1 U2 small nuclear ribonucleoprotein B'', putative [Plasmodium vivax]|eukprot:XP_001608337.1 U2 small nuclear ribonucleoprotein B'' [Plasmodium vivax Sal-1]
MDPFDIPPNQTLYVNNLEEKVNVQDLRDLLFEFFCPYGNVLDVVIKKANQSRGQAFVVFNTVASSTLAYKHLKGKLFLNKHININYAKTKSRIIEKLEGTYKSITNYKSAAGLGSRANVFTLFVQNLPNEINKSALEILFSQYPGFCEVRHIPGRNVAFVDFSSYQNGEVAMSGLQSFKVTPQHPMKISWSG